ncbi:hypothetical protein SAMN05216338_1001808 [Bradyrhizobium sp. Rc2d]|nr:hypothetical protein SAMN05216338_1001808 [Bradyrhizobium sp. Rc2d]
MCRSSRLTLEGRSYVVMIAEPGSGGRGSVGRESCGQGGLLSVSPKASRGRTALSGSSRQHFDGNVHNAVEPCGAGEPRVRQNRVVLTVVATVKPWRMRHWRQPARVP